jgi:hypothetical protein
LEPVTHFLTGACLGRAGLNRKTALATATLTLAAEAADLDIVGQFRGPVFGFAHHRGFTHSFLGVPLVAALVVAFIYGIWRLRGRKAKNPNLPPRWGVLYLYACLAGLSHMLLDFTAALESRTYQDATAMRASAFPYWSNPFRWSGVVETKNFFAVMWVDSLAPDVDPENSMEIHYKPEETPVTLAAKKSYLGRVYLDWAQYPITETEQLSLPEQGYAVRFRDLRYQYPRQSRSALSAGVILDRDLRVIAEFFGHRVRRPPEEH